MMMGLEISNTTEGLTVILTTLLVIIQRGYQKGASETSNRTTVFNKAFDQGSTGGELPSLWLQ